MFAPPTQVAGAVQVRWVRARAGPRGRGRAGAPPRLLARRRAARAGPAQRARARPAHAVTPACRTLYVRAVYDISKTLLKF